MKLRYSDFAHSIDIDALEEALGFEPIDHPTPDEDRGYCPLPWNSHSNGDTTGKFSINREKRVYGCWVCGGGSLLDLAMAIRGEDLEPTIKWLHQFANREETDEEFLDELNRLLARPENRQPTIPYFNSHVLDRFSDPIEEAMEWDSETEAWVSFIERRALNLEAIEFAQIKYQAKAYRPLRHEDPAQCIEYYGPAICFPHFWKGQLVGWQQRWLDQEEDRPRHVPKYTMTSDFPKNETLWGYDASKDRLRRNRVIPYRPQEGVTVVESVPSALFLWSHGYPAVATFGSNISAAQLKLLRTFPNLYLGADNDAAGEKWVHELSAYLERYTSLLILPVVSDKVGADIGDLANDPSILDALYDYATETWEYDSFLG